MKKTAADLKLKERVKELKCLYAISKSAWEEEHDLNAFLSKTLSILPEAMQFPTLAEASIVVGKDTLHTPGFSKCNTTIAAVLMVGNKKYGAVKSGYRSPKGSRKKQSFLPEEKKLIKMVARELSLYI
jgi:hypothetical protein